MLFTVFIIAKHFQITHKYLIREQTTQLKKWSKEVNRHFTQERCGWQISAWKDTPFLTSREIQIKATRAVTTHLSGGWNKNQSNKKPGNVKCWWDCRAAGRDSYTASGDNTATQENSWTESYDTLIIWPTDERLLTTVPFINAQTGHDLNVPEMMNKQIVICP